MKLIIKFVLLLTCLHCSGMQGMDEEEFTTVNIDSSYYCGDVVVEGRSETHSKQGLKLDGLEWQKKQNSSWRAILYSCFSAKKSK